MNSVSGQQCGLIPAVRSLQCSLFTVQLLSCSPLQTHTVLSSFSRPLQGFSLKVSAHCCVVNSSVLKQCSDLHALAELFLHAGPVLVPTDTEPPLYFSFIPVQLLGEPLQLFTVWTLKEHKTGLLLNTFFLRCVLAKPQIPKQEMSACEHIITPGSGVQCVYMNKERAPEQTRACTYRVGLIEPLQDGVGLSSPRHSLLNLKYVGTGLGHQPVYTEEREGTLDLNHHRDTV